MNTHVKITTSEPADLSRRSFLVGTAAAGLALGYAAVPGLDSALAATAPANFDRASGTRSLPTGSSR
jgi:isoquinoline 1-oxidoreductase subunit beta